MIEVSSLIAEGSERLVSAELPGKGWGYRSRGQFFVEPTCWALLAMLSNEGTKVPGALETLLTARHPSGAFGITAGDPDPSWVTSVAVLALVSLGRPEEARAAGAYLERWKAPPEGKPLSEKEIEASEAIYETNARIPAWPWLGDTSPWVEPTALACLALRALGRERDDARVADGIRYLTNRACKRGGWNYGTPVVFGSVLEPLAIPTAKGVLALMLCAPGAEVSGLIERSLEELERVLRGNASRRAQAWGALAFGVAGEREKARAHAVRAVDTEDGRGRWDGRIDTVALTVLGLRAADGHLPGCLR